MDEQRTVTVAPRPARTWDAIVSHARTAETIACVLAAGRQESNGLRIATYNRLRDERAFAFLRKLAVPAAYVAELAVVGNGGEAGIAAVRLDHSARGYLAANGLIRPARGSRFEATDWRATVAATVPGNAVVRFHTGAMPRMTITEATPLAVVERDMRTADGGSRSWPGSDLLLRMSQVFRLVEFVRTQGGFAVYRLTDAGERELTRAREATGGAKLGARDVALLAEVDRCKHGDLGELTIPRKRAVARAIEAGWIAEGPLIEGTGRRSLRVTKGGRDAVASHTAPAAVPPREPNLRLPELLHGMWVRLSNRKHTGIGAGWVRVHEVRSPDPALNLLPGNREVWVTDDMREEPFLYGGRPLFHTNRFERQPGR